VTSRDIRRLHREGQLLDFAFVWREGMTDWMTLRRALGKTSDDSIKVNGTAKTDKEGSQGSQGKADAGDTIRIHDTAKTGTHDKQDKADVIADENKTTDAPAEPRRSVANPRNRASSVGARNRAAAAGARNRASSVGARSMSPFAAPTADISPDAVSHPSGGDGNDDAGRRHGRRGSHYQNSPTPSVEPGSPRELSTPVPGSPSPWGSAAAPTSGAAGSAGGTAVGTPGSQRASRGGRRSVSSSSSRGWRSTPARRGQPQQGNHQSPPNPSPYRRQRSTSLSGPRAAAPRSTSAWLPQMGTVELVSV
jgi:hypothetical protein